MAEADHKHVSAAEAAEALDPSVGSGVPQTAPDVLYVDAEHEPPTSWRPTRKWLAATVTAGVGLVTLFAQHGWHFDEHTTIATATIVGQRIISYLIPNEPTA